MANIITIDIDLLQAELQAQELFLTQADWNSIIVSLERAKVSE